MLTEQEGDGANLDLEKEADQQHTDERKDDHGKKARFELGPCHAALISPRDNFKYYPLILKTIWLTSGREIHE